MARRTVRLPNGPGRPAGTRWEPAAGGRRSLALATIVVLALLAGEADTASPPAAAAEPESFVVSCYDAVRDIVQETLISECRGRILSKEEAAEIRMRQQERIKRQIDEAATSTMPGKRLKGVGSGFFIDTGGMLMTNRHVVKNCPTIVILSTDGRRGEAFLVAADADHDLAVVRTDLKPQAIAPFAMGPIEYANRTVAAIGYPNQGLPPIKPMLSPGKGVERRELAPGLPVAVIKADIRQGNSGGPLLDVTTGSVIGVVFAKIDTPGMYRKTGEVIRDVGFAVPHDVVVRFLHEHGISFLMPRSPQVPAAGELLDAARPYVARIECWQ